jgi:PAS domain S-box-containing protein
MKELARPDVNGDMIAEYARLSQELRECQARLQGVVDNIPGGIVFQSVFTDGVARIVYMSDSSERVIGVPADAIMADSGKAYELIVEEHRQAYAEAEARAVREGCKFDGEIQIRRPDGELRWLRMIGTPQEREDGLVVYDGVVIDATEQKLAHQAELRALRYQVNPHFLFNSLGAVSTLILDGEADKAEQMVMSLASFYRKSLQLDPLQLLPLRDEVGLQGLYLEVEKVRFPEELSVEFNMDPAVELALVPGMILQPIVENAIKYGLGAAGTRMTLSLGARKRGDQLQILVRNDRCAGNRRPGTGFGLKMTRRRLEMAFESDFSLDARPDRDGGYRVEMSMPLRFQEVQIAPGVES